MQQIEFKNPLFLLLLIPYAVAVIWYIYSKIYNSDIAIALSSESVVKIKKSFRTRTYKFLPLLRFAAILMLIIAMSRPGKGVHFSSVKNLGIDIMIALDLSGSMRGEDFQPRNRLTVAKQVIGDFIKRRKSDRIGMVVFAGDAYLQCPLTIEHDMISDILEELDFDTVDIQGTAIGDALALSASRMMDDKSRSRIILLLTDGMNNKGIIDPETAAKTCVEMGIKVYSVGIGKEGRVSYPANRGFSIGKQWVNNHFDESTLKKVSQMTGGKFYRATDSGVLWQNIKDIDMLEKSEVDMKIFHEFYDRFQIFLIIFASLFFLEILLRSLFYRKLP